MSRVLSWSIALLASAAVAGCSYTPKTTGGAQDQPSRTQTDGIFNTGSSAGTHTSAPRPANTEPMVATRPNNPGASAPRNPAPAPVTRSAPVSRTANGMNWNAMAYPTGDKRTSALLIEKGVPQQVRLNQPFDMMLTVTNLTGQTINDVTVSDTMYEGFRYQSSTPAGNASGGGVTWNLGQLGPNEKKTIKVTGVATREGTVNSCATVSFNPTLCASIPVVQPALKLTKTCPTEVSMCDPIVWRYEVCNTGTGTVNNVKVTEALPAGITTADGRQTITFDAGSLKPGDCRPFNVTLKAQRTGRYGGMARAEGSGVTANSADCATVVRQPKLTITKTGDNKRFIGRNVTYTITVTNTGDGVAPNTRITDNMPAGARFVSATDGGTLQGSNVVWNVGSLAPRATKTVSVTMTTGTAGVLRNTASASADCADAVTANASTEYAGIPAILLEVIDIEDPVEVGGQTTYVITATNQGSAPDTNIRIVATLEAAMTYVSSQGATTGTNRGGVITFAPLPSLAAKQRAEWRITVRAVVEGDIRFKVAMNTDQIGRPVEETEATNLY